jgi:hypothetical protein
MIGRASSDDRLYDTVQLSRLHGERDTAVWRDHRRLGAVAGGGETVAGATLPV